MTAALLRLNRRTFASLRHRNYRLFFVGQIISVTGTWMQNVAMAWLVLELTGSPVAVGILVLCQFLPFSMLGLFAGVFADRLDPRRLVMTTQAAAMVLATTPGAAHAARRPEPWQIYAARRAARHRARLRRSCAAGVHVSDGRAGRAPECGRAQLVALQRRAGRRAGDRRRDRRRLRVRASASPSTP